MIQFSGILEKLGSEYENEKVSYQLMLDKCAKINLSDYLGKKIEINFNFSIYCPNCFKLQKKLYQNYCYPCSLLLPQADICMVRPERCHFHKGTCRDELWGEKHCFKMHDLYLAKSSGIKIGMTRNKITRWIDQGAVEAQVVAIYEDRYACGLVEHKIAQNFSDKTSWQKMLKNDLSEKTIDDCYSTIEGLLEKEEFKNFSFENKRYYFTYPVLEFPTKVKSLKLDKQSYIEGILHGIKGQYLILDTGVFNVRSHTGYEVEISIED